MEYTCGICETKWMQLTEVVLLSTGKLIAGITCPRCGQNYMNVPDENLLEHLDIFLERFLI